CNCRRTEWPRLSSAWLQPWRNCTLPYWHSVSVGRKSSRLRRFPDRHGARAVAPRLAHVGDDRCDLPIGQQMTEGWHAVRARIAIGARREAAVEHHAQRIACRCHYDGLIVRERRIRGRCTFTIGGVTALAMPVVDLCACSVERL